MGKTYIDTVKYVVYANAEIDGIVEKPDVVGALFGQTEGLLGDELDLRELQKSGRVGRIEVDLKPKMGKATGQIILPSSLDRVETAILAAALETVDRVGPCEAKIKIERIEDTRNLKRSAVVSRAKDILKNLITNTVPESREIAEQVRDEVKTAEVSGYGVEKLPAGPNIANADNIIVVEGRADVITLLKCDIKNVIGMMGKNLPQTVIDLSKQKTMTVFVDGDRGGDLIIKNMADMAEVDFVAKAPDGKEVEELTQKEVIKCLRRKIPLEQFMAKTFSDYEPKRESNGKREYEHKKEQPEPRREQVETRREPRQEQRFEPRYEQEQPITAPASPTPDANAKASENFEVILKELTGTLKGVLLDKDLNIISEVDVRNLATEMQNAKNVNAVVFDGIITQRLVDLANQNQLQFLVGIKHGRIENKGNVTIFVA